MKRLVYIVICFLTLVFFAKAESKPMKVMHYVQHQSLNKDLSLSQNDISIVLIDSNDDFCFENNDEADFGKNSFDHFVLLNFGEVISSNQNHQSYKTVAYTNGFSSFPHITAVPLYILFQTMMIPSAN